MIFQAVAWLRQYLYEIGFFKSHNAEAYTISVGNISVGGTGKTPMAIYLMQSYLAMGKKVAYLSRGYGRKTKGFLQVLPHKGTAFDYGEEALLVARNFPNCLVAVCEDRVLGAAKMKQITDLEILILDDAFQHFPIYRDEDIVVIDAQKLPFEDKMLPFGKLREPISALRRADKLIINKLTDERQIPLLREKFVPYLAASAQIFFCKPQLGEAVHFFSQKKQALNSLKACAFAGIGNPVFFHTQLKDAGVEIIDFFTFSDHHFYTPADFEKMPKDAILLTTEKDFCRIIGTEVETFLAKREIFFVPMQLQWWEKGFEFSY